MKEWTDWDLGIIKGRMNERTERWLGNKRLGQVS
jgi:hypothetical protein